MCKKEEIMRSAIMVAAQNSMAGIGGPFGAAIVKDGEVLCVNSNSVLFDKDPTAHAEINAIREACQILGTHDLSGCELYATREPCPMCLSAIIWANIKKVYYCNTAKEAEDIGFRDSHIYNYIQSAERDESVLTLEKVEIPHSKALYTHYKEKHKQMY